MKFTVVIPLYNKEKHIGRAIKSVINQTYKEFEIVIVNDGSTDSSVEEAIKIKDPRIRIIEQVNSGVSSARNKGIDKAKYDYIGFLDADDEWKPFFLESIKTLIEQYSSAGAYATAYKIQNEGGERTIPLSVEAIEQNWEGIIDDYFKYAFKAPLISASSVVIKKEVFKYLGGFPLGIKRGEDLDMWIRLALNYKIAYSNKICAIYFHDADNRACKRKGKLSESLASYAENILIKGKEKGTDSIYFEEYMIKNIISKARYMIEENRTKEARRLLYEYRYTKMNKKHLVKTYILSFVSKSLLNFIRL